MRYRNWIRWFEPLDRERLLQSALETANWLEQYGHIEGDTEHWDVLPGKEVGPDDLLLRDTSLYGGAAGIAFYYLRLYLATQDAQWLARAEAGITYVMERYRGIEDFRTDAPFLAGAFIGFMNGPAGGAYVARLLYTYTHNERYRDYARRVTDDLIAAATEEDGTLTWYGFYGILGEGGLILYLLDAYETFHDPAYLEAADKAAAYIERRKEPAPGGGYRWYVMDTETFPTIGQPGGYFPGFEYGAAGCGYILASVYAMTQNPAYLEAARGAAEYIRNLADVSPDGEAALVRYNDTYLTDLYYLGVCQGPIGTSRLFYRLYEITGEQPYLDFVIQLTNGLIASGAPLRHSQGYWHTNCYCCGAAGMIEHFVNIHRLTHDERYLTAAYEAAEALIGESTIQDGHRNWYTAWNRHEPWSSDPYSGLYHGSAGCAAALLVLAEHIGNGTALPTYLEDPYKA